MFQRCVETTLDIVHPFPVVFKGLFQQLLSWEFAAIFIYSIIQVDTSRMCFQKKGKKSFEKDHHDLGMYENIRLKHTYLK